VDVGEHVDKDAGVVVEEEVAGEVAGAIVTVMRRGVEVQLMRKRVPGSR
jgi:hypothetical protein